MDLINDDAVRQFLIQVVAPIIVIVIGIGIMLRAKKADYGEVMQVSVITIIGIAFVVGGATLFAIGGRLADAIS